MISVRPVKFSGENNMVFIEAYMDQLLRLLREEFQQRLAYVGLQGSFL